MGIEEVVINGKCYKFHTPTSYDEMKLLKKQIKQIREKIKATQPGGCYANKLTKNKKHFYYEDYPALLEHLEKLII
jgi:hypothetical protein